MVHAGSDILMCITIGESVFLASIITEASVGLTHPSKKSEEDNIFDPTLPSDHPILKVSDVYCIQIFTLCLE